ncbi:MAG: hypothetical protein ACFFAJ_07730 [Candidatus Hodarchaeota archaeon]
MSSKDMKVICIWRSDEFVVFDSKNKPTDDEAYLIIDEPTEKISVHIPSHFSIVTQRIIERRIQSIAKSGFLLPKSTIRIGGGFNVSISKEDKIPDVLLQEGHKYKLGEPVPYIEPEIQDIEAPMESSESEYVPTFLTQEVIGVTDDIPIQQTLEKKPIIEEIPQETIVPEQLYDDDLSIAGRFVLALSKTGDVYLSRADEGFSVEYSQGRVDFLVKDGDLQILSTKRIPEGDQTLNQAIAEAKR